jgi:hypothetical protein
VGRVARVPPGFLNAVGKFVTSDEKVWRIPAAAKFAVVQCDRILVGRAEFLAVHGPVFLRHSRPGTQQDREGNNAAMHNGRAYSRARGAFHLLFH